jgi:hypothetical protein
MIRKFESFSEEITFDRAYEYVRIFNNDSYPVPENTIFKYIPDRFFDGDFLISDLSEIGDISDEDKKLFIKCYNELDKELNLDSIPDYFDLNIFFLDLSDIKDGSYSIVTSTIRSDIKSIQFDINTIPSVRTFPDRKRIEFNIQEWDSISQEILPIVNRIKDAGYKVKSYLLTHGIIQLLVSF